MSEVAFISYHRDLETRPLLGMIREDFGALRLHYPHLLALTLKYSAGPNGLPASGAEHQRISKIEDRLEVGVRPGAEYLGHVTGEGRTVILFVSRTPQIAPVTVGLGLFKKETFTITAPSSDAWAWFEASLAPTNIEVVASKYAPLYKLLAQHGDRHELPRAVDFAANFSTGAGRDAFLEAVFELGFVLGKKGKWDPEPDYLWCEFVKETAVLPVVMGPIVLELEVLAARNGGKFDGWACPVVS